MFVERSAAHYSDYVANQLDILFTTTRHAVQQSISSLIHQQESGSEKHVIDDLNVTGADSLKTMDQGSDANVLATSVEPTLDS